MEFALFAPMQAGFSEPAQRTIRQKASTQLKYRIRTAPLYVMLRLKTSIYRFAVLIWLDLFAG